MLRLRLMLRILWLIIAFFCNPVFAQPTVAFFYGKQAPIAQLCMYDMVIVDPYSDFNPQVYCNAMSQPFAYVSLGEVPADAPYAKNIKSGWVIGKNVAWNNNKVIDQTQQKWQEFFLNQVIAPLWQKGYRGFFLDTLDSYTLAVHDPQQQQKQIEGIVSIIQQIKSRYPDVKIILNRGFQVLPRVHSQVYAIVIESLYHAWNQQKQRYEETPLTEQKQLLAEIDKMQQMHLPIIIVDYLPPNQQDKAQDLTDQITKQGLIPWITDSTLQKIYIPKIQELSRQILIVFNTEKKIPIQFVPALRLLGSMVEYVGYIPKYLDVTEIKTLPMTDLNSKYAGIIIWFQIQQPKNDYLFHWIQKQIANRIPIVFLENFGVSIENKELEKLGLSISSVKASIASLKIAKMNPTFVGKEVSPPINPYDFYPLRSKSSQILLQMKNEYQQTEDSVAITPWGGYAVVPDVILYLPNFYALWVINPLEFLHRALRLQDFPIPDTTTENGRRLMSVHIDGDGFAYTAKWIGGRFAAEELRDRILKQFRIPTSVSVIMGEIAPNGIHPKISPQLMEIARSIFALPWVEIASHTFSHPMYWQKASYKDLNLEGEPFSIKIPNYKFNLASEITGSVDFINTKLAPANKKCHLFFWSGLADPSIEALALTYHDNLLNINGLSTHIDYHYSSLAGIRPMGMELGGYYQVFAPIDMDFFYMNSLAGPLYGYEKVIQTLELTDKPYRFKPIDLYFHIYAASYPAALQAVIKVYRWALTQPVMNIYISDYIKKVLDYYQISIGKHNASWIIYSKGDLRELRSMRNLGYPDLLKSQNLIGFRENKNDFYIHLGPNRLTVLNYQKEKPLQPYLVDANARVTKFSRDKNQLVIQFQGYMPLQFTFANVNQCRISSQTSLKKLQNQDKTVSYSSNKESDEIHIIC